MSLEHSSPGAIHLAEALAKRVSELDAKCRQLEQRLAEKEAMLRVAMGSAADWQSKYERATARMDGK